jgi:hypothetical protein
MLVERAVITEFLVVCRAAEAPVIFEIPSVSGRFSSLPIVLREFWEMVWQWPWMPAF